MFNILSARQQKFTLWNKQKKQTYLKHKKDSLFMKSTRANTISKFKYSKAQMPMNYNPLLHQDNVVKQVYKHRIRGFKGGVEYPHYNLWQQSHGNGCNMREHKSCVTVFSSS